MIYKKTIKHGQKYFSDLLLDTHVHCGGCGDVNSGDNYIRLRLVTPVPIELHDMDSGESARIIFSTSEGAKYYLHLYNHSIVEDISWVGVNMLTGDEGIRLMEDLQCTQEDVNNKLWRSNSVYFGWENVTLDSYADGEYTKCPNCENIEDTATSGIELGAAGLTLRSKLREGYSDDSDIGVNLDDVSLLISLVDIEGNSVSAPNGDMTPNSDTRRAFSSFIEQVTSVPEW